MAIAHVSVGTLGENLSSGSTDVPIPAHSIGNVGVMHFIGFDNTAPSIPGWTLLDATIRNEGSLWHWIYVISFTEDTSTSVSVPEIGSGVVEVVSGAATTGTVTYLDDNTSDTTGLLPSFSGAGFRIAFGVIYGARTQHATTPLGLSTGTATATATLRAWLTSLGASYRTVVGTIDASAASSAAYSFRWTTGSSSSNGLIVTLDEASSTFTGTADVVGPPPVVAATGDFTKPTWSGVAALAGSKPTIAAAGSFLPLGFYGTADLQGPKPVVAAAGATTPPTYSATVALSSPKPTLAATGSFTAPTPSTASLVAPKPTLAAAGSFTRVWLGTADLQGPKPAVAGAGTVQLPIRTGDADLQAPLPTVTAAGSFISRLPIVPVQPRSVDDVLYGDRITSYRWEVLKHNSNGTDTLLGVLDGVSDADLKWSQTQAVKGSGKARVIDLDEAADGLLRVADLNLASLRLRPVQVIVGLPENPLGTFLVTNASEDWDDTGRVWEMELLDKCTVPSQDQVDQSYSVAAGTLILNEVKDILVSAGETITLDGTSTLATANGMAWEAGTSKLKIINDLLDVAGYNALWMDGYGNFKATPRVLPDLRSTTYDLLGVPREMRDGEKSIYRPSWTRDRDSFGVPNKVIAVEAASGSGSSALTGTWTNTDPSSPYSYAARGNRWITQTITDVECPAGTTSQVIAFLQDRAQATLIQMSAVQAQVKIEHLPIPIRVSEVMRFAHTEAGVDAKHVITDIQLELKATGLMKTTLQEVISL